MSTREELDATLTAWLGFRECYMEELRLVHRGFSVEVVMDTIWNRRGRVRGNLNTPRLATLTFIGVVRLELGDTTLPAHQPDLVADPSLVGNGAHEVAIVTSIDATENASLGVRFKWDLDRHIDIHFQRFTVDPPVPVWDDPDLTSRPLPDPPKLP
jgi:hypothetical protein